MKMTRNMIFISLSIMIFILTGCSLNRKSAKETSINKSDNNTTNNAPAIPSTDTAKPQVTNDTSTNVENAQAEPSEQAKEIDGFILLSSLDKNLVINLKYATTDNFTKKVIYPNSICVLRKGTAEKLVKANADFMKLGYRIKVWDAYRPVYVQRIFWNIVHDSRFVANPNTGGSIHNKGCAVDVTLVDQNGNELTMPSKFDDFTVNAYRTNPNMKSEAKKNMDLLTKYMVKNGFTTIDTEWWHFEDVDSKNYNIADINLNLFLGQN